MSLNSYFERAACHIAHYFVLYCFAPSLLWLAADVFEDVVHLLQSSTICLRNEKECPHERKEAEDGKEYIRTEAGVLYQWRCDETL